MFFFSLREIVLFINNKSTHTHIDTYNDKCMKQTIQNTDPSLKKWNTINKNQERKI